MTSTIIHLYQVRAAVLLVALCIAKVALAQTTAFTYQGKLTDAANPADGLFDMQFKLFNTQDIGTGTQQGPSITNSSVQVTKGTFSLLLDFGNVFDGSARYLEISLRPTGSPAARTVLSPRQPITSTPYSIRSASAATADIATNATQLGGMTPASYVQFNPTGNVAIGASTLSPTVTPNHRLGVFGGPAWTTHAWGGAIELENASAIGWQANSSGARFGIGRTNAGLFFFRTASELGTATSPPVYDFKIDNSGNIGIGNIDLNTNLANAKLNVFTASGSHGLIHADGTAAVGTYVDSTGGWLGTRSNHPLHFFTNNSTPRMTIDTNGNVGIGTTPDIISKLIVESSANGPAIAAINSNIGGAVYGSSISGIAINGVSNTGYAGFFQGTVRVTGAKLQLQALGSAGSEQLCRNANDEVSTCSSSLRYKKDFQPFGDGLSLINRLRPITYKWKSDNTPDVGFGAEDVEKIEPLFVSYNKKGEIEGVKYDRLSVAFVNAFKQQQQQIETQQRQNEQQQGLIERQQKQIDALIKIVCKAEPQAEVCRHQKR